MATKSITNQTTTSQPFANTTSSGSAANTTGTTGFTNQNIFATPGGVNQTQLVKQLGSFQGAGRDVISGYMQNPSPFFNQIQARGQEIAGLNTQRNIENIFTQAGRNTYGSVPGFTQEAIARTQRAGQAQFSDFTRQNALSAEAARGQAAQFAAAHVPPTIGAQGTTTSTSGSTTSTTGMTTAGGQSTSLTSETGNEGLGTWLPTVSGGIAGVLGSLFGGEDNDGNPLTGQALGDKIFGSGGVLSAGIGAGWEGATAAGGALAGLLGLGGSAATSGAMVGTSGFISGLGATASIAPGSAASSAIVGLLSNPFTIAAGAALVGYLAFRGKIGKGRKTADQIVPTQNDLTENLGTTIDGFWEDYNAGNIKSPEQVQGIIDIIELMQTEFTDFTNEFGDDTEAPRQARETMDPLINSLLHDKGSLYDMLDTITELTGQDLNDPSTWIGENGEFIHWPGQEDREPATPGTAPNSETPSSAPTSPLLSPPDRQVYSYPNAPSGSSQLQVGQTAPGFGGLDIIEQGKGALVNARMPGRARISSGDSGIALGTVALNPSGQRMVMASDGQRMGWRPEKRQTQTLGNTTNPLLGGY